MNHLNLVDYKGSFVADSRQVSEMIDKRHSDLIRDIDNYINILENADLRSQDFFIESTYKVDGNNKTYRNFLITKIGCDMVANKMIGTKGVLFSAAYTKKFADMEKKLTAQIPQTPLEVIQMAVNRMVEQEQRINNVENDVKNISGIFTMDNVEWRKKVDSLLKRIAKNWTGVDPYRSVRTLSYERLENRAGCKLDVRLNNRKERAAAKGMSKSYVQKINKMDVIEEEKRLKEIYIQVVKEMAIQHRVNLDDMEDVI